MTRTDPCRRITLHFSHIFLTDGRTFTSACVLFCFPLLVPVGDATTAEVVGSELDLHTIARENSDVVHPHLPGDVCEHLVPVLELDTEHGVRERLNHRSLDQDRVVLGLRQGLSTTSTSDLSERAKRPRHSTRSLSRLHAG